MDGSSHAGESRALSMPEADMNNDARAAVASMVRASRAIAEAAEVLATESKRIVSLSGQARDMELAAERRVAAPAPHRASVLSANAPGLPAWARNPRLVVAIGASVIVVAMIGAVAVGTMRAGAPRLPELLPPSGASLGAPLSDPVHVARPQRLVPSDTAPVLPAREAIPSHFLPQAPTR